MEMDLNNLINKIQQDGIDSAGKKAKEIIDQAEKKAADIVQKAQKMGADIIEQSQKKADQYQRSSIDTIKQSSRDVLLTLRSRVQEFFGRIVKEEVSKSLSTEVIQEAILKIAEKFSPDQEIEVILTEEEKKALKDSLIRELQKRKAEIKTTDKIDRGFRIGQKGTNSFFDFSETAIAEAFVKFLNPKLVKQLDINLGIGQEEKNNG
ncbi:MAG: hypothetical protein PHQ52_01140 [Candidatus Omnitrophica bacterium]|nr:hypothetical protein [Candidatus Omnitrophota bacterium]